MGMAQGDPGHLLAQELAGAKRVAPGEETALGGVRGAYALLLHVPHPLHFARTGIPETALSGWFVYAGSARGAGGIGARIGRHFRRGKPVRWHIDALSNVADQITAFALPDGSECQIVDRLLRSGKFEPALAGFGSSDCRRCTAHLLRPYRS